MKVFYEMKKDTFKAIVQDSQYRCQICGRTAKSEEDLYDPVALQMTVRSELSRFYVPSPSDAVQPTLTTRFNVLSSLLYHLTVLPKFIYKVHPVFLPSIHIVVSQRVRSSSRIIRRLVQSRGIVISLGYQAAPR